MCVRVSWLLAGVLALLGGCISDQILELGVRPAQPSPDMMSVVADMEPDLAQEMGQEDMAPGRVVFVESAESLVFEAEDYDARLFGVAEADGHQWVELKDQLGDGPSSQGAYMIAQPELNLTLQLELTGPRLDYLIWVDQPGTFYVWARILAYTGDDNAIYAGVDGQASTLSRWGMRVPPGVMRARWSWIGQVSDDQGSERAQVTLNRAGLHTFHLWMRDDSVRVDRVVLHRQEGFVPQDVGPPASERQRKR